MLQQYFCTDLLLVSLCASLELYGTLISNTILSDSYSILAHLQPMHALDLLSQQPIDDSMLLHSIQSLE